MSVSSRVLRKIRGDNDILEKSKEEESDIDDVPANATRASVNINRYDLLNDETQSESEVKEDDDREQDSVYHRRTGNDSRVSKKKKKKKKRKSFLPTSQKHSSEDLDEVERSVREVNAILGYTTPSAVDAKAAAAIVVERGILAVDKKHLNPKNELKRIFGSEAIQAHETQKSRARNRGRVKQLWLVPHRQQWADLSRSGPSLSMSMLESVDGVQYFKYDHGPHYQTVERKFLACVESVDPMKLLMITNANPFHVNTLIQLSEMCRMNEEYPTAATLVEKALYALENAFHPMFSLAKGNCRLDYRRQENRALFIALFAHLRYVGQRACYRTALEFCKLLLSLSPDDDPLAIVLAMDFYAIRAGEYRWLLQLIEETESRRNLSQLPNMAFGRAVAHFHLQELDKADELLQDALIMFPGVLIPLLEKCSVAPDANTLASYFFMDACNRQSPALNQLVQLYIGRSYHIWKESAVLKWLEKNTRIVLNRAAANDPLIPEYAAKRTKRFECKTPRAVQRHVLLSDIPDIPVTEHGTTFNFDPLPPLDSINIYQGPERSQPLADLGNTVSLFFRSMMPNFSPSAAIVVNEDAEAAPEPQEEGAAGGAALQQSVTTLLDAMRELFSNLHDADGEGTDDSAVEDA